ncbi:hypothetical protein Mapa_015169 [Marchantia paleacea]|nr:hypothetical protein Mapa_015169 [Marchantia paleacea]
MRFADLLHPCVLRVPFRVLFLHNHLSDSDTAPPRKCSDPLNGQQTPRMPQSPELNRGEAQHRGLLPERNGQLVR